MASPLRWFRRHAKILMVVLGSAAMAIFGLGPVFDTLSRPSAHNRPETEVVARWNGGDITRTELEVMKRRHYQSRRFLQGVFEQAVAEKGDTFDVMAEPIIPINESNQSQASGVEEQLIRRLMLAEKAKQEGIVVSDGVVNDYITMTSGGLGFSRNDLVRINEKANLGDCSLENVKRHLQIELLAQQIQRYNVAGLYTEPSPVEAADYYSRVSQRVACQVLPVSVEQYVNKVNEEPSAAEANQLFEAGKMDYPNPNQEKPGFKLANKMKVQYLVGDFETFMQNELVKLTDEEVQTRYNELVKKKDDLVMEPIPQDDNTIQIDTPPPVNLQAPGESETQSTDEVDPPPAMKEAETDAVEEKPATGESDKSAPEEKTDAATDTQTPSESPETETPNVKTPELEKPKTETPDAQTPDAQTPDAQTPDAQTPESDTPETDDDNPLRDDGQSMIVLGTKNQLVSVAVQDDESADEENSETADPETKTDTETKTDVDNDETADDADDTVSPPPSSVSPEGTDAPVVTPDQEIKKRVVPLKDCVDKVKRSMVFQDARLKLEESIKRANAEIFVYHTEIMTWDATNEAERGDEPAEPNFEGLAKEHNLQLHETALLEEADLAKETIGQIDVPVTYTLPNGYKQQGYRLSAQLLFDRFDQTRLYDPVDVTVGSGDMYLYWLTEKVDARIPEFNEVQPEIVKYWKAKKAYELALADAKQIAETANKENKLLAEIHGERVTDTGEFTWFSTFGRFDFGRPNGVTKPGDKFMETAYSLDKLEAGVAPNLSKDTVYVVQRTNDRKSAEEVGDEYLTDQYFKFRRVSPDVQSVARFYSRDLYEKWYKEMSDSMGLKFYGR